MLPILVAAALSDTPLQPPSSLKVMSFNIRYGTAQDGPNHWNYRREMVLDVIREQKAEIAAIQEALRFQLDEIVRALPHYKFVGIGRDDGKDAGEFSAILYDSRCLKPDASGTFWLSDTPEVPNSKSWGNNVTRICTYARFSGLGKPIWIFNAHLDHESQLAREKGVELILSRIKDLSKGEPNLVTGDFNAGEENAAVKLMLASGYLDTYRVSHPLEKTVGTFSGFKQGQISGEKIDYIFMPKGMFRAVSASILRNGKDGRYPSDHFPVVAELTLSP